jgi:hypothetical protein
MMAEHAHLFAMPWNSVEAQIERMPLPLTNASIIGVL